MGEIMNQFTENVKVTGRFFIDLREELIEGGSGS